MGPLLQQRLLAEFGTPGQIFCATSEQLGAVPGLGPKLVQALRAARDEVDVDAQLQLARDHQIDMFLPADDGYPPLLREIPDPPGVLFALGRFLPADRLAVAIVGTRHATHYGCRQAARLATSLAQAGITVVSGMARGIDTAAHQAALAAGGRTIAVLAGGVLKPYPPENAALARQISQQGCLCSEAPPTMPPVGGMFPKRNRLISGMTLGTVVVEAAARSGALITARLAWEQNREVFAVPGPIDSRQSTGPHRLLRDGAKLVATLDDILAELGPLAHTVQHDDGSSIRAPVELALNAIETQVLQAIHVEGSLLDQITASCGLPVPRVLATISVLEARGLVQRVSGNRVLRI